MQAILETWMFNAGTLLLSLLLLLLLLGSMAVQCSQKCLFDINFLNVNKWPPREFYSKVELLAVRTKKVGSSLFLFSWLDGVFSMNNVLFWASSALFAEFVKTWGLARGWGMCIFFFWCWATNLLFVSGIRYFDDFFLGHLDVGASFSAWINDWVHFWCLSLKKAYVICIVEVKVKGTLDLYN